MGTKSSTDDLQPFTDTSAQAFARRFWLTDPTGHLPEMKVLVEHGKFVFIGGPWHGNRYRVADTSPRRLIQEWIWAAEVAGYRYGIASAQAAIALKAHRIQRRSFVQLSRTWYRQVEERQEIFTVHLHPDDPGEGLLGEFTIVQDVDDAGSWVLRVRDDSWVVLPEFADFFAWLAAASGRSAEDLRAGLVACGVVDLTVEKR